MGGKHLKKLRAEKSKVHLKNKKLPKGQNLTNTAFMIKKILTFDQIKKVNKDEPKFSWNLPLKELLIKLNHYNSTSRLNSICGIKELVIKYPEILRRPSLKTLISRLLELITDEEHKIRVTATDLISYLFDKISPASITIFYNILNVHLGCAMTHRNASVQQDSLKLLDIMVKHSSEAVKQNFKAITQNFLRIIKSYLYESHHEVFSLGKSKQGLEKTKREMLHRFYNFLTVGYSGVSEEKQNDCRSISANIMSKQKIYLRNIGSHYKKIPDLSLLQKNSEIKEKLFNDFDLVEFKNLCSLIIPLLFDTWIESSPDCRFDESPSECVLTEGGGELLSLVLKIFLFLYEKTMMLQDENLDHWFISNYSVDFQKFFLSNFPYLPSKTTKKFKSGCCNDSVKGFYIFMKQNFIICYLAYSFNLVPENSNIEIKMENYVSGALMTKNTTEIEILPKLVETAVNFSKNQKTNSLLRKMKEVYDMSNIDFQKSMSRILMKITLEESENIFKDHCIIDWIKSLPSRLCESLISVQEVETILKLVVRSEGEEVLREMEHKVECILKNLTNIKTEGILHFEGQKMITHILYRCSNKVIMGIMKKTLLDEIYSEDLKNYILDIFSYKLRNQLEIC